jgi:hypothetical protein
VLEGHGGSHSSERDSTGALTWHSVHPGFKVQNNEPVAVYAVTGGVVGPDGERLAHPQTPSIIRAESEFVFGSMAGFQIPPFWLPPFAGDVDPHQLVPYFVQLTDASERRWEGVIDFRDVVPRLAFKRMSKRA